MNFSIGDETTKYYNFHEYDDQNNWICIADEFLINDTIYLKEREIIIKIWYRSMKGHIVVLVQFVGNQIILMS